MPFTILWEHTNQHLELRILHTTARSQIYQVQYKEKVKNRQSQNIKGTGFLNHKVQPSEVHHC